MNPNKPKMALVDFAFVDAMAKVLQSGLRAKDREIDGWKLIDWTDKTQMEYQSALLRHYKDFDACQYPEDALEHLASIAVNAMILAYHESIGRYHETS